MTSWRAQARADQEAQSAEFAVSAQYMTDLDDAVRTRPQTTERKEEALAFHKFKVGQSVRFIGGMKYSTNVRGIYKIVRLLPSETRDCQYHIKNVTDGQERVVNESELE